MVDHLAIAGSLPDMNVVNKDNTHGRGWHIINGGPIEKGADYEDFGARYWISYESTSGTCENVWLDGIKVFDSVDADSEDWWDHPRYCQHREKHSYRADYFLNNGKWELGAN